MERLTQLMQAQRDAIEADPEARTARETILSILVAVDKGDVTEGQALRILSYQARRMADTAHAPSIARLPQTFGRCRARPC
jgi:hypothetical protein